ncbi:hypothetical protein KHQ82_03875 [Mycoplasmatota bacterium]|nr:hypothetical protein KHQ82_03875 [Mycoplasmatota bacterium]
MFLELLSKSEKHQFLDLAFHMTRADGNVVDSESLSVQRKIVEMGDEIKDYAPGDFDKAVANFTNSTKMVQRIVLLNLIELSLSDDFYHAEEHSFIEMILDEWEVTPKMKSSLVKLVYMEKDLREKAKIILSE